MDIMKMPEIEVPPAWEAIDISALQGPAPILGAPDVGKSTLTRYLYARLVAAGRRVGVLDGDPGQSAIGPPTTMTLALGAGSEATFPPQGARWQVFVGSTSPVAHMLRLVVGAGRLAQAARQAEVDVVLYDTTGLVDPKQGGLYLKLAKIDLLRPTAVLALHENGELDPLLEALRRSERVTLIELPPSPGARKRDRKARQAYRARRFEQYFAEATPLTVSWPAFAVLPRPHFERKRLLAFENEAGFVAGLGIVTSLDLDRYEVTVRTPLQSLDEVDVIRIGDVAIHPDTFRDQPLKKL